MDEILKKLSEIEDAASRILGRADEQKKLLSDEMKERTEAYDRELEQAHAKRIQEEQESLQRQREEKLEDIRVSMQNQMNQMESAYEKQHEQLAGDIVRRILEA